MSDAFLVEDFVPTVSPDDERRIGQLAIEARLLREDVLAWMEESGCNRQEEAPMWRDCAIARNKLRDALNDLLDLEDESDSKHRRPHRRGR